MYIVKTKTTEDECGSDHECEPDDVMTSVMVNLSAYVSCVFVKHGSEHEY